MTEIQERYFAALTESRTKDADALDRPNLRGVKKSIVDKYSDQAHFVYELIQNADDAGATEATFDVYSDKLTFTHNGSRRFEVTNPETEGEDYDNHALGDVNAITGIGLSSKPDSNKKGNAIGKFGMGFKSIFQYTTTPEIYDPNIAFRIERQIVPKRIDHDYPGRKPNETLFVFPFNNAEAKRPERDSLEKLNSLLFPTLFLNNLKVITFNYRATIGEYRKDVVETREFGEDDECTRCERIKYSKVVQSAVTTEYMLLFSRTDADNHRYSIGFRQDADGKLIAADYKAFCFFPTKHQTKLKFLIHAPFLLTDSRETIKEFEDHNRDMVDKLSDLVYDSLIYMRDMRTPGGLRLIDDGVLDIIPIGNCGDSDFFEPFWEKIAQCFENERILPTVNGYVKKEIAYWPATKQVPIVFPDEKLQLLYAKDQIQWVFRSKWNDADLDDEESGFIRGCISSSPSEVAMLDRITPEFIEAQSLMWLSGLYKWLDESEDRRKKARRLPIFLNRQKKAVAAFDQRDQHILFLPAQGADNYETINEELFKDEHAKELIDRYKIMAPSREDRIRYIIDEKLSNCEDDEAGAQFKEVIEYYSSLPQDDKERLAGKMAGKVRLKVVDLKTGEKSYRSSQPLYLDIEFIHEFFVGMDNVYVVDTKYYRDLIAQRFLADFEGLLPRLGVASMPIIMAHEMEHMEWYRFRERFNKLGISFSHPADRYYHEQKFKEQYIHGASTFLKRMLKENDLGTKKKLSLMLWTVLRYHASQFNDAKVTDYSYSILGHYVCSFVGGAHCNFLSGVHEYSYRGMWHEGFDSSQLLDLRSAEWIAIDDSAFVAPEGLPINRIPVEYEHGDENDRILRMLKVGPKEVPVEIKAEIESINRAHAEAEARERLSEEQKRTMDIGEAARRLGLTMEDLEEKARQKRERKIAEERVAATSASYDGGQGDLAHDNVEPNSNVGVFGGNSHSAHGVEHVGSKVNSLMSRIEKGVQEYKENFKQHTPPPPLPDPDDETDDDELTPKAVNFSERIKKREQKQAVEIAELERGDELQQQAQSQERYTFGWFKGLLELEMLGKEKNAENQRELSICFTKIEREPGTERTYILKRPNRNIPAWVEDLSGIPLHMVFGGSPVQAIIEVMSVQSFNLRVKLKDCAGLEQVNLSKLIEAKIQAQRPTFLLNELKRRFDALPFEDAKNLKTDLTENIEFIFGPPGTGKTTFLASDRIIPLMQREKDCRVLVLAPTNKAADVLASRIISEVGDTSYRNWLIRFGNTADEMLERTGVCPGKDIDLKKYPRHTVITTIARFPYDMCITGNSEPIPLVNQKWDYIVIDEASMIPLVNIIYPLYKKADAKFIIAGDPLQIEPIISYELWKNENIYTMIGLKDFESPKTEPHDYKVTRLTTQYRSVPAIGKIFSAYSYKGVLGHCRGEDESRKLAADGLPEIKTLTKIMFPVSPYESIYRLKRLGLNGGSSYQIYSALFTFEFVCAIARKMKPQERKFRIGVISPYRAQADLVQKLVESERLPDCVEISAATVHGFQGDECEMIVALFNPPPGISDRSGSFINKKNIINVAISRARDYFVLLMPDDDTQNLGNMREIRKVEALMRRDADNFVQYASSEFEKAIFGNEKFIEENSFSTGHQTVNVYGVPEMRYEVRAEDTAVDVQIHKEAKKTKSLADERQQDQVRTSGDAAGVETGVGVGSRFAVFAMQQDEETVRKYLVAKARMEVADQNNDKPTLVIAQYELRRYEQRLNEMRRRFCEGHKVDVSFDDAVAALILNLNERRGV